MGLDMYLEDVHTEADECAYWRKANAIHGWFDRYFDGVEDCKHYPVSKECLQELLEDCKYVYAAKDTAYFEDIAAENLPTMSGFFFGSCGYDEDYIFDLKNTIDQIEKILSNYDNYENLCYMAWW